MTLTVTVSYRFWVSTSDLSLIFGCIQSVWRALEWKKMLLSDWLTGPSHLSSTDRLDSGKPRSLPPVHRLVMCSSTFPGETCHEWCGCLGQKNPATSPTHFCLGQPLTRHQNPPWSYIKPTSGHSEVLAPFLPALWTTVAYLLNHVVDAVVEESLAL